VTSSPTAGDPERTNAHSTCEQRVHVESGVAYGVIGANLHVWGHGAPLYLLENWHDAPSVDPDWLRELPGRLLSTRAEVARFTGDTAGLSQLHEWRGADARFAVRWLYGDRGAGKTCLAARFACDSAAADWKVIAATRGTGRVLPTLDRQDLTLGTMEGVLLIIDEADRWPRSNLAWLLTNKLFRRPAGTAKTRILMVSRTLDDWPGIRHELVSEQPVTSSQRLQPAARPAEGR
jgi:hypothetical protein